MGVHTPSLLPLLPNSPYKGLCPLQHLADAVLGALSPLCHTPAFSQLSAAHCLQPRLHCWPRPHFRRVALAGAGGKPRPMPVLRGLATASQPPNAL